MTTEQQRYLAYMLRLWQVSSDGELIWRTSAQEWPSITLQQVPHYALPHPSSVPLNQSRIFVNSRRF
jgi:hypothetical protein